MRRNKKRLELVYSASSERRERNADEMSPTIRDLIINFSGRGDRPGFEREMAALQPVRSAASS